MPKLLVRFDSQRNLVFPLPKGETVIGRGDDAQLQLPNVSVSRRHSRIVVNGYESVIQDLESQNGTLVNGVPAIDQRLSPKDVIKVGRFTLVFLGDGSDDRFYDGRCVDYLAPYQPSALASSGDEATFALSKAALKALMEERSLADTARIVSETDRRRFWYPEDRSLSFGSGAMIPTPSWYVLGTSAEITWDGKSHVLWRRSFWVPTTVNGVSVTARPLRPKDRLTIAGHRFRYEVVDP